MRYGPTVSHETVRLFPNTEKKVEPKHLHPGAVLENGATLEGGAVFPLIIMAPK